MEKSRAKRLPGAMRKEQLLDTAAKLFATRGYARATTAELAKAAGVTEPIIYRHFASKRELFVALIERTARQTLEHWESTLAGATDAADRLGRLLSDNPMVSDETRDSYRVFLQAISEVDDDVIHKAVVKHITNLHAFVTRELERAQKERKVTKVFSPQIVAWLLLHIGLGYGVLSAMRVPGQGEDPSGLHVRDVLGRVLVRRRVESPRSRKSRG